MIPEFTPAEYARYRFAVVCHGAVRARCGTREEAASLTALMGCICHGAAVVVDAPHALAITGDPAQAWQVPS
jgi:hypothetical protein